MGYDSGGLFLNTGDLLLERVIFQQISMKAGAGADGLAPAQFPSNGISKADANGTKGGDGFPGSDGFPGGYAYLIGQLNGTLTLTDTVIGYGVSIFAGKGGNGGDGVGGQIGTNGGWGGIGGDGGQGGHVAIVALFGSSSLSITTAFTANYGSVFTGKQGLGGLGGNGGSGLFDSGIDGRNGWSGAHGQGSEGGQGGFSLRAPSAVDPNATEHLLYQGQSLDTLIYI